MATKLLVLVTLLFGQVLSDGNSEEPQALAAVLPQPLLWQLNNQWQQLLAPMANLRQDLGSRQKRQLGMGMGYMDPNCLPYGGGMYQGGLGGLGGGMYQGGLGGGMYPGLGGLGGGMYQGGLGGLGGGMYPGLGMQGMMGYPMMGLILRGEKEQSKKPASQSNTPTASNQSQFIVRNLENGSQDIKQGEDSQYLLRGTKTN